MRRHRAGQEVFRVAPDGQATWLPRANRGFSLTRPGLPIGGHGHPVTFTLPAGHWRLETAHAQQFST